MDDIKPFVKNENNLKTLYKAVRKATSDEK